MTRLRKHRIFPTLLALALLLVTVTLTNLHAEDEDDDSPAPSPPTVPYKVPTLGDFYLSLLDPYPASMGVGLDYFLGRFLGLRVAFGNGSAIGYALGLEFRPVISKINPYFGFNMCSAGDPGSTSQTTVARLVFYYFNTGFNWKWDSGLFIEPGFNWGLTPVQGKQAFKPYIHFGLSF